MSARLAKLRALAADPAATDAERALAREHIDRIVGTRGAEDDYLVDDRDVEVPDDLIAAMDEAMARIAGMRGVYGNARRRAAEHRLGRDAAKAWLDSRGQPLARGSR